MSKGGFSVYAIRRRSFPSLGQLEPGAELLFRLYDQDLGVLNFRVRRTSIAPDKGNLLSASGLTHLNHRAARARVWKRNDGRWYIGIDKRDQVHTHHREQPQPRRKRGHKIGGYRYRAHA